MNRDARRVARYRFGATLRSRWGGYVTVIVMVGLLGGLAMGAVAAARRTQSSFPELLARTNPSALRLGTGVYNPALHLAAYEPGLINYIARLPHVRHVENAALLNVVPYLRPDGTSGPNVGPAPGDPTSINMTGSIDGLFFNDDRVSITHGRMANPARPDEIVVQASFSNMVRVGQVISIGVYTNAQEAQPGFSTASRPYLRMNVTVVGIGTSNDAIVADDVDSGGSFDILFTPAFTRSLLACCAVATPDTDIQVDGGSRGVADVETEIDRAYTAVKADTPVFYVTATDEAKAERAIKPEAIALGVFGGIAGLAALLIAGQAIGRQLRLGAGDLSVLRALGAGPAMTTSDGLIGVGAAIVIGAVLAVGVAVALSPLAPIGPVHRFDRSPGIAADWTVLASGFVTLTAGLAAIAVLLAYRQAPHRGAERRQRAGERRSGLAHAAAASGLPAPAVAGIRFAVEPGAGRSTVPVRSAIVGVSLAVVVVTATLTFGASLHTLVSRPSLYGWNWNYELLASGGSGAIPQAQVTGLLDHDADVTAWSGIYFSTLQIDGNGIPVIGASPGAQVAPPILSGHPFDGADQVVLGALTLAQLHKHVGDTVVVSNGVTAPTRLRIVGTAAMPALGSTVNQHPSMGTGALLSYTLIPASARDASDDPVTGPNAILVRVRRGAPLSSLQPIATATSTTLDGGVNVNAVLRPAEIVNYRSMGKTPALLGLALAAGSVAALGLTLIASVRRRRRDLALLKTLGFTRRQVAAVIAWQSSVAVTIGTAVGIPLGIALGRSLWILFAHDIHVVPEPTVPVLSIVLVVAAALVLANLVAALPGRAAARTPIALLLRAE